MENVEEFTKKTWNFTYALRVRKWSKWMKPVLPILNDFEFFNFEKVDRF